MKKAKLDLIDSLNSHLALPITQHFHRKGLEVKVGTDVPDPNIILYSTCSKNS